MGRRQTRQLFGAFTGIIDRLQRNLTNCIAPEVGIVTKIQLLQLDLQAMQVHAADVEPSPNTQLSRRISLTSAVPWTEKYC